LEIFREPYDFQTYCAALDGGASLGFVPTMGALHAGHLSLVRASRRQDHITVASIFVNPTQFGPSEDFDRYPRALAADCALLEQEGVEAVFAPAAAAMYAPGGASWIEVEGLSQRLDGASRPGHFRGVATVVFKLFQLAAPTRAYFGQKDAAQVAVIRRMIQDFFLPMELVVCPIVREPDGLAMSSRNALLNPEQRRAARALARALRKLGEAYDRGERAAAPLLEAGQAVIAAEPGLHLDYLAAVDANTLLPVTQAAAGTLFAVAAFADRTRLIDNARIAPDGTFAL